MNNSKLQEIESEREARALKVREIIARKFDCHLAIVGMGSIVGDGLYLCLAIEKEFKFMASASQWQACRTVSDVIELVERKVNQ